MSDPPPVKFPRTKHLVDTGSVSRTDLVLDMAEADNFINTNVICEEKVDGSNLGISFDHDWNIRAQKRSHWITGASEPQYCKLDGWLSKHRASLADALGQDFILFGEWLFAQHTVAYDCLPDWFLAFDIYDKQNEFFISRSKMVEKLHQTDIKVVRCIKEGVFSSMEELNLLLAQELSAYSSNTHIEGVYLRVECEGKLDKRTKLVRPGFVQAVNSSIHWSKNTIKSNNVRTDLWTHTGDDHHENGMNHGEINKPVDALVWDDGCHMYGSNAIWLAQRDGTKNNLDGPKLQRLKLLTPSEIEELTRRGIREEDIRETVEAEVDACGWAPFVTQNGVQILWPSAQKLRMNYGLLASSFMDEEQLRVISEEHGVIVDKEELHSGRSQICHGGISAHIQYALILISQCHVDMMMKSNLECSLEEYDQMIVDLLEALSEKEFPESSGTSWNVLHAHRLMMIARHRGRSKQFHGCVEAAQEAIWVNPGAPFAHHLCAKAYYQIGKIDDALLEFTTTRNIILAEKCKAPKSKHVNAALKFLTSLCDVTDLLPNVEKGIAVCKEKLLFGNSQFGTSCDSVTPVIDTPGNYPSTPYLPFSPSSPEENVQVCNSGQKYLVNMPIVVSEKLDGGNCCIYRGCAYSRSHGHLATKPWFSAVKALAATSCTELPDHLALFGENMEAIHSICYDRLTHPFYLFGVLDTKSSVWLSWTRVRATAAALDLPTVPTIFVGEFDSLAKMKVWMDEEVIKPSSLGYTSAREGFVVRLYGEFHSSAFPNSIAKYVRQGHIQTNADFERTWQKAKWCLSNFQTTRLDL